MINNPLTSDLVSVVIPSYNYAGYLERRIDSILEQTYQNIEVIVIDDCSQDNSVDILQKYASNLKVTILAQKKNSGWISTNNQGIELANGKYILFAQCDDVCDRTMIERLVNSMQDAPAVGLAFCRSLLVDEAGGALGEDYDGREPAFKNRCKHDTLIKKHEMAVFLLHSCVVPNLSAVLVRKNCFETVGGFPAEYPACSDWAWFFNVVEHFDIAYVAEPLNNFMQHGNTIRNLTKERVLFEEYFRLLLLNQKKIKLSTLERARARMRVMELWSHHLISGSWSGIANFPFHFSKIVKKDPLVMIFFPSAILIRIISLIGKIIRKAIKI